MFSIKLSPMLETGSSFSDRRHSLLQDRSRENRAQCCYERCVDEEVAGGLG